MDINLEQIISAIKENRTISFIYYKGEEEYYQRVCPYYVFKYKDNMYLTGQLNNINSTRYPTYRIDRIKEIEVTTLTFNHSKKSLLEYLKNTKFNPRQISLIEINKESDLKQLISMLGSKSNNGKQDEYKRHPKLEKVFDYYYNSLKMQNLMDIAIDIKEETYYYLISDNNIDTLFSSMDKELIMGNDFGDLFPAWDKLIKYQPDLMLYIGYPYLISNGKFVPIFYFPVIYDLDSNKIKLSCNDFEVNGRFLQDNLELTYDEKKELLAKIQTKTNLDSKFFDKLNFYFKDALDNTELTNQGVLFLNINTSFTKSLIKEIKEMKKLRKNNLQVPLLSIIEESDLSNVKNEVKHSYNIIKTNDSQKKVIDHLSSEISLVQGPPGTGKTQTIINAIANEVISGNKVLVASVNNKAVDNIVDRIEQEGIFNGILRMGNQGYKNAAYGKIIEAIEKEYVACHKTNTVELKRKSTDLYGESLEKEKLIVYIEELEQQKNSLDDALRLQKNEVKEREIKIIECKKSIEIIDDLNINECNQYVVKLNRLSAECSLINEKRNAWYWKLFSGLGIDYDRFHIKKVIKKLDRSGINDEYYNSDIYIDEVNNKISRLIIFLQARILTLKTEEITNKLIELDIDKVQKELKTLQNDKIKNDKMLLQIVHNNKVSMVMKKHKEKLLNYIESSQVNNPPRNLRVFDELLDVFPVIVTTSLSVASNVSFDACFDLVIIDEASQCDVASSLPIIKRGKRIMIVGDNKQLSPVIRIEEYLDNKNLEIYDLSCSEQVYSYRKNSIFDTINNITKQTPLLLKEHYRCHPEIIKFSNVNFYNNSLTIKSKSAEEPFQGMLAINVNGFTQYENKSRSRSGFNKLEGDSILEFLISKYSQIKDKSIGVITPFRRQKELIKEKIVSYVKKIENKEQQEFFKNITVGTVHTFQGDEYDIILFSTVLSTGAKDGSIKWINENPNLLNVAVTRAKETFVLIGNTDFINQKEGIFSDLVKYIESLDNVRKIEVKNILNIYKTIFKEDYKLLIDSEFTKSLLNKGEEKVYFILKKVINELFKNLELGIKIRVADIINVSKELVSIDEFLYSQGAHFDFVVFDTLNNTKPLFAVEFDGKYHRIDKKTIMNDTKKNNICKTFNFSLERISSEDYVTEELITNMFSRYKKE